MTGVVCALTANLLSTPPSYNVPVPTITAIESAEVQNWFDQAENYWTQHLGKPVTARLVIVGDNRSYACDGWNNQSTELTSYSLSRFCSGNNVVALSAIDVRALSTYQGGNLYEEFLINHEVGHAVQGALGDLDRSPTPAMLPQIEEQATCYAGMAMADRLSLESRRTLETFIASTSIDSNHGGSEGQVQALQHGLGSEGC